jgi:dihydroxyacetone kinase-like protein
MTISRDDVLGWIKNCAAALADNRDYLIELDSTIGDGDHGANMNRGFQAVLGKLPDIADKDIGTIFKAVGFTLISTVGGASGPLYGVLFMQMGAVSDGKIELTLADWAEAVEAGLNAVVLRGKANHGDKTMVDALIPSVEVLKAASANNMSLPDALRECAHAAERGVQDTIPLIARKGRASYLGERSIGHQDPGATSSSLLLQAAAYTWTNGS